MDQVIHVAVNTTTGWPMFVGSLNIWFSFLHRGSIMSGINVLYQKSPVVVQLWILHQECTPDCNFLPVTGTKWKVHNLWWSIAFHIVHMWKYMYIVDTGKIHTNGNDYFNIHSEHEHVIFIGHTTWMCFFVFLPCSSCLTNSVFYLQHLSNTKCKCKIMSESFIDPFEEVLTWLLTTWCTSLRYIRFIADYMVILAK